MISAQLAVAILDTVTGEDEGRGAVVGSADSDTLAGLAIDRSNLLVVEERRSAGVVAVAVVAREGEEVDDAALATTGRDDVRLVIYCVPISRTTCPELI